MWIEYRSRAHLLRLVRALVLLDQVTWIIPTTRWWLSKHGKDKTPSMTMIWILAAQVLRVDNTRRLDDVCANWWFFRASNAIHCNGPGTKSLYPLWLIPISPPPCHICSHGQRLLIIVITSMMHWTMVHAIPTHVMSYKSWNLCVCNYNVMYR